MLQKLLNLLNSSKNTVVLTGAGVSTDSGLPDFRSENGLWKGKDVFGLASVDTLHLQKEDTIEKFVSRIIDFVEFYNWRMQEVNKHKPNVSHNILADWQKRGIISRVVTQNVDGYHQQAGSENVLDMHGDIRTLRCNACNKDYGGYYGKDVFCSCGGAIRPNIVLFGEKVHQYEEVIITCLKAELLLVMGTSLSVFTSSVLVRYALDAGAKVAIINNTPTEYDEHVDLVINRPVGEVLQEINGSLAPSV